MKQITEELYDRLKVESILRPEAHLDNVDVENHSLDYWIDKLRKAIWEVEKEEKNYIDILLLYAKSIKITKKDVVVAAKAIIKAERETFSETISGRHLKEMHTYIDDIDFDINEDNYEEWLELLEQAYRYSFDDGHMYQIETEPREFDITTLGKENIPDCEDCNGDGSVICPECSGERMYPCEHCDGTGNILYESGNYADGTPRLKSKPCPQCSGTGKKKCQECQGNGRVKCSSCDGSGKAIKGSHAQEVESYKDIYRLNRKIDFYLVDNFEIIRSNDSSIYQIINNEWFCPSSFFQLFQYNHEGNKLFIDHSQETIQKICEENDNYKKIVKMYLPSKEEQKDMVCLAGNFFLLQDLTEIILTHNIDGEDEEEYLYLYKGNLWFDTSFLNTMSIWDKFIKTMKHKALRIIDKI